MTNKEAIEHLNNKLNISYFTEEDNEALDMAIDALQIVDSIKDMVTAKKSWSTHSCCYWVDGEGCMCGREYCPDNYTCDSFD